MPFTFLAGVVVLSHLGFLGFVLFGGLFFSHWPWLIWIHLPAVAYAILVLTTGWRCPLTDLEKRLRSLGGQEPYRVGFLSRYLWSPIGRPVPGLVIDVAFVAAIFLVNARAYLAWEAV